MLLLTFLVAHGVTKGERTAYRQWDEANVVPQVVFDAFAPGMSMVTISCRLKFYERAGVEEYYMYDPDAGEAMGWVHNGQQFEEVDTLHGWQKLLALGGVLASKTCELSLIRPDGERFMSYVELAESYERDRERANQEHERAEQERARADHYAAREKMLLARLRAFRV
jgi:hypothetical protein